MVGITVVVRARVVDLAGLVHRRQHCDVVGEMAMEKPSTGTVGRPDQRGGLADTDHFGDGHATLCGRIDRVDTGARASVCIDAKVKAMQVHRVRLERRIDDAPADGVAEGVVEALGVGPALAVHDRELPPDGTARISL